MTVHLLGIDLGGTNTTAGLVSSAGRVTARVTFPTEAVLGPQDWVRRLRLQVNRLAACAKVPLGSLRGAGIGAAGLIDQDTGRILQSPNFRGWVRVPAARLLARALGLPVAIDNDVNAMALGETLFGAGRGMTDVFCLALGTGVGGGLVLGGRLYRGVTYSAGEVGHVTLDPQGPLCACGNRGCLEAFVGTNGILRTARLQVRRSPASRLAKLARRRTISVKDVADLAKAGCPSARSVLCRTGEMLGVGLAGIVNLLNPGAIIVGGRIAQSGEWLFGPLRETLKNRAMGVPARAVSIRRARLGPHAGMIGSAMLPRGYARVFR